MFVRSLGFSALFLAFLTICAPQISAAQPAPDPVRAEDTLGDVIGRPESYIATSEDTLYDIARRFDVGIVALMTANPGIDRWVPGAGTLLAIPKEHVLPPVERRGIVINLAEMRLFYFPDPYHVMTFPIGIGMHGWQTRTGKTVITKKRIHPAWIPPPSIRQEIPSLPEMIPPGPDNPLGDYALNLGFTGYLIHGTNRPAGIGRRSSHGCIRLYPEDIALLFDAVRTGTPVQIVDMPFKTGWLGHHLLLEVSPTQEQSDQIMQGDRMLVEGEDNRATIGAIEKAAGDATIDWAALYKAVLERRGIPVVVATRTSE